MIRRNSVLAALLSCVALISACRTAADTHVSSTPKISASDQVNILERQADSSTSPEVWGRTALATWVLAGNPGQAEKWAAKALEKNAAEPAALYTRVLLAREALDEMGVARNALALLKNAPTSEFAEIAATRLQDVAQASPAIDELIATELAPLETESMGLQGRAAQRAREVLIGIRDGHNLEQKAGMLRSKTATPLEWTLVGPFETTRIREFAKSSPFDDRNHVLAASYPGALGTVEPRVMPTPNGVLDLDAEPWRGDVFEALTDVDVSTGGKYLLSLRGIMQAAVFVDGTEVLRRTPYPRRAPERSWGGVDLPAGKHRVRVKFARADAGWMALSLARADGAPSDLRFTPTAVGSAVPAGAARRDDSVQLVAPKPSESAAWAVDMFLHIQRETPFDGETARTDLDALIAAVGESASLRSLRVDLTGSDLDLPRALVSSRTMKDLDAILALQPTNARALAGRFEQERADKNFDAAAARLEKLEAATGPNNVRVKLMKARFAVDRGDIVTSRQLVDGALAIEPGRCEAIEFRLDMARRNAEVKNVEALTPKLLDCPGGLAANAAYFRTHMKLKEAKPLLERLVTRNPTSITSRRGLADALVAMGDAKGADAVLEPLAKFWPRRNDALKRMAVVRDLTGDAEGARKLGARALQLDGADLGLARTLTADSNDDVMQWAARDGVKAIEAFKKDDFRPNALAIHVLDAGALQVNDDGSTTERVHSIVQVLDKRGIDRFGEVTLPGDAALIVLRTIKADGTVLDAENIAGKDSISLPNLEPGDFVEYAYLRANGPRPAAISGWQGGQFIFQEDDVPVFETTYTVRAPTALGLEVDTHLLPDPPKVVKEGDMLTVTYTKRRVDAFVREPNAVSDAEVLPWLEAGAGARQETVVNQMGDWVVLHSRVTGEAEDFVRGFEKLAVGDRINAIVEKLRNEMRGDSNTMDFSDWSGASLAIGRGNRMLALKATLAAAGIPSHIVLVRPFGANPADFRFPRNDLFSAVLLRIEPPGAAPMWMDFTLRAAPLNLIPLALSEGDAYTIPEPGEQTEHFRLPKVNPQQDRTEAEMQLTLGRDGTLTGTISQSAHGFDAAGLRRRLEQSNRPQLLKQQERALQSTFRGAVLTDLQITDSGDPEKPVVATSTIRVPNYGRRADGTIALPAHFGAAQMSQRYINRAERKTPLLLAADDWSRVHVTLTLPPNVNVQPPAPVDVKTTFGSFQATWKQNGATLTFDEELLVNRGRIQPAQYPDFKTFAAAIDSAQQREIPLGAMSL